VFI
jgi:hypothetical protein